MRLVLPAILPAMIIACGSFTDPNDEDSDSLELDLELELRTGDYWEFLATSSSSSRAGLQPGHRSTKDFSVFRITLGLPVEVGGRTAFPLIYEPDTTNYEGRRLQQWKYVALDESGNLLGSRDAGKFESVVERGFFSPIADPEVVHDTLPGRYNRYAAWSVQPQSCVGVSDECFRRLFLVPGVGPVGKVDTTNVGDVVNFRRVSYTVELIGTSFTPASSSFAPIDPGWRRATPVGNILGEQSATWGSIGRAIAADQAMYFFVDQRLAPFHTCLTVGGVQVYDVGNDTWDRIVTPICDVLAAGIVDGRLVILENNDGTLSRWDLDPVTNRWEERVLTRPWTSGQCGSYTAVEGTSEFAVMCSGKLLLIDVESGDQTVEVEVPDQSAGALLSMGRDVYYGVADGSTFYRYDLDMKGWTQLSGLPRPRTGFTLVAHRGEIWALGGDCPDFSSPCPDNRAPGAEVDILDPLTGTWELREDLGLVFPCNSPGAASIDGVLHVLDLCHISGMGPHAVLVQDSASPLSTEGGNDRY